MDEISDTMLCSMCECSIEYQNALLVHNMTMKKAMPSQVKRNCSWIFRYALVHCLAQSFKKKQINPFVDMLRFEPWGMQDQNILRPRSKDRVAILNRERESKTSYVTWVFLASE